MAVIPEDRATTTSGSSRAGPIGGRYALREVIGRGGMGEVWLGEDLLLGRPVAVKVLHAELSFDETALARFRREARSAASLNHPRIATVYDAGELPWTPPRPYLVMEYVDGQTLAERLHQGPLPVHDAVGFTIGVLDGLAFAHARDLVHRDIKPANVMITDGGGVKVMDFGIALALGGPDTTRTTTGTVMGTAAYMSPEQACGRTTDSRSDLYSTGCLLYELLTGRPPFRADSALALIYQHVHETPEAPSRLRPAVPPELDAVVLGALAKDPGRRCAGAEDMSAALRGLRLPTALHLPQAPRLSTDGAETVRLGRSGATAPAARPPDTLLEEPRPGTGHRARVLVATGALLAVAAAAVLTGATQAGPGQPSAQQGRGTPGATAPASAPTTGNGSAGNRSTTSSTGRVRIPGDLVGRRVGPAEAELAGLGLRFALAPGSPAGTDTIVTGTLPPVGTEATVGDTVVLLVAETATASTAPSSTGRSPASASPSAASPSSSAASPSPTADPPSPSATSSTPTGAPPRSPAPPLPPLAVPPPG
ncbi:protein kinase [Streptacidiphilus sp. N1-10]|uniref:non-specific serine/threonine protein kinase n=1 Tax=Streptacidiphilus jeojiensis TaxID=3229225 RepID=A0ABV6XLB7_9ACTN